MTMHDDPSLPVLERALRRLAEPRDCDERLRLELRRQLAAQPRPQARRRLSMRVAFSAALAAAATAIATVLLVGAGSSDGPAVADAAIVHHAVEALTPPANEILHVKLVGAQNGVPVAAESWLQTSPPYAGRALKGPAGHQSEFAQDGTTAFDYDPRTNTVTESRQSSPDPFSDPISQVRRELERGQAQGASTVAIAGAPLYRIALPHGLVGYFDTHDYRPRYLDEPQRDGTVLRLRVAAFEYLPMTSSNAALLSLTRQHPSAAVVAGSNGARGK